MPPNGQTYVRDVIQRCEDMIFTQIWHGVDVSRFRGWYMNFQSDDEKYFAARVLDALIFRSDAQTRSLALHLFQSSLPVLLQTTPHTDFDTDHWIDRLRGNEDPGIRLVPVIRANDPPTKSGPLVCRLLKRHLGLNDRWMIWPSQIERWQLRGIRRFILIDDFLGTGYQFRKFFTELSIPADCDPDLFAYLPLVAHERGMNRTRERFPSLRVETAEMLDESHRLFSEGSTTFDDGENSVATARTFYSKLLDKFELKLKPTLAFGYSKLGLAFAFEHATPNATLPIFWANAGGLRPLFVR